MMHALRSLMMLAAVLSLAATAARAQEPEFRPRVEDNPWDFRLRLYNHPGEWDLANNVSVKLKMVGKDTVIVDGNGKHLLKVNAPECITEYCLSPERGCIVLAVWNTDDGRGLDYSALVVIRALKSGPEVSRIWESGDDAVLKGRWWVSDLGAVSEDGDLILANFGEIPAGKNAVDYRWQTWKVAPPTRLGIGLQIANGQIQDKPDEQGASDKTNQRR